MKKLEIIRKVKLRNISAILLRQRLKHLKIWPHYKNPIDFLRYFFSKIDEAFSENILSNFMQPYIDSELN